MTACICITREDIGVGPQQVDAMIRYWLCLACLRPCLLTFKDHQYSGTACCGALARTQRVDRPVQARGL